MNNLQLNDNHINFKATPEEIKSIQKACFNLASKPVKKISKEPVDVAEIGNKAYISRMEKGGQSIVKIELDNNNGARAYTLIKTGTPEATETFLALPKNVEKIADVIDSLKETIKKTTAKESYTDI